MSVDLQGSRAASAIVTKALHQDDSLPALEVLSELDPGDWAVIERIDSDHDLGVHLHELGLVPGERIRLVRRSPFGDPFELEVMGYRLAIRRDEADQIWVRREPRHP